MSYYECNRCKFKTKYKNDMRRHLDRILKCSKDLNAYFYNDEELYINSLIPKKYNEIQENEEENNVATEKNVAVENNVATENNLEVENNVEVEKNVIETINENINENEPEKKNDFFICNYCNKHFKKSYNLKRHQKINCKKYIKDQENNNSNTQKNIENNIQTQNNIQSQNNIQNVIQNQYQNIIIIKSEKSELKSFYEDWSIEHIDNYLKMVMLLSKTKYTDFLTEVMKNKENLNIIVDKNSESGLVYKNESEMYVKIKMKEILEQSMVKLNDQLQKLFNECLDNECNMHEDFINLIKDEKDNNNIKFSDYMSDISLKHNVNSLLLDIFSKKKEDAVNVAKDICNKLEY